MSVGPIHEVVAVIDTGDHVVQFAGSWKDRGISHPHEWLIVILVGARVTSHRRVEVGGSFFVMHESLEDAVFDNGNVFALNALIIQVYRYG